MKSGLASVLEILSKAEQARLEGRRNVVALLPLDPASIVARVLVDEQTAFAQQPLRVLLENVASVVQGHVIERSITDWPFENFWDNPKEPRHSKLLGYFLDPLKDRRCGSFLLKELLAIIAPGEDLPVEGCRVELPERRRIDLLIVRTCGDERDFAAVIENKVNSAPHQKDQLRRYVEIVHQEHPGIPLDRIFAFYLPRTDDPNADRILIEDKRKVEEFSEPNCPDCHPRWIQISFKRHMQDWLRKVLDEWPHALSVEMRENLTHYRNLIRYLINKHMELDMNTKILAQLEQAGDAALPTWADVVAVKQSAEALQPCVESVLRGKLLLAIFDGLPPEDAWLCLDNDHSRRVNVNSPYDQCFLEDMNVCLHADDRVAVCFGAGPTTVWLGYMKIGDPTGQNVEEMVLQETSAWQQVDSGDEWYKYRWWHEIYCDKYVENLAPKIIGQLTDMRNSLAARLQAIKSMP